MFCTSCGASNDDAARVCTSCGHNLPRLSAAGAPVQIENYMTAAIAVTVCCCMPFGIPAIVYASQVNTKLLAGDVEGARDSSKKAKMWSWLSFGSAALFGVLYALLMAVGAIADK